MAAMTPIPPIDRTSATFKTDVDQLFLERLPRFITEANALKIDLDTVEAKQDAAAASATAAGAAAEAAIYTSGATQWVSGTTYAKGAVVWSPADARTYRRLVAGAGTTDPANDNTGTWQALSYRPLAVLHLQNQNVSEVSGAAGSTVTRKLNTVLVNTIAGASLASDQVTLPAGTYDVDGLVPLPANSTNQAYLFNVTDNATAVFGNATFGYGSCFVRGRITISSTKVFRVSHYVSVESIPLVVSPGIGTTFIGTILHITKVA